MIFSGLVLFAVASLVSIVSAQSGANGGYDLSDRNSLNVDAEVYIHAEVQDVYYKKPAGTTGADRVVFSFAKGGLLLPIKDNLQDEKSSETNLAKPFFFSRTECVAVNLNQTGNVKLAEPVVIIDDYDAYIYQYVDYADYVMYADFERPFFEFEATAFKQANNASTSCAPVTADGTVSRANFTNRLCYTEDTFCNVWIGTGADGYGWQYWGNGNTKATADFGVRVFPRWNWTGTREEFILNSTNLLDVRRVDSSSDAIGKFTLSRTFSVPFEFEKCNISDDGVVLFNINEDGFLVRYLSCNTLHLSENSNFVFDFANKFTESRLTQFKIADSTGFLGGQRWNFTFTTIRAKFASESTVRIDPDQYLEPYVYLNRLPTGYRLDGVNWLTTIERPLSGFDIVKTWFTVVKPGTLAPGSTSTAPPITTTTPRPTVTTPVLIPCPRGCNGAGACNAFTGICACDAGFIVDSVLGCKSTIETSTAPPAGQTTTVAVTVTVETFATTPAPETTAPPQETPRDTVDPSLQQGTFTGSLAATPPPRTRAPPATPATTITTAASQTMLTLATVLVVISVALF